MKPNETEKGLQDVAQRKEPLTKTEAIALFKCLADSSRLDILASLRGAPMYVEQLAERLGLSPSTVSFHLKKLESAGLVSAQKEQYYMMYTLCPALLQENVMSLISGEENARLDEREELYRRRVIDSFFKYGKLVSIPAQRKKRLIILEEMLKAFDKNRSYTEREVNIIIADFHDDFCTIRREFIVEGMMTRAHRKTGMIYDVASRALN